jgi:16S rRNA processing protein RimM
LADSAVAQTPNAAAPQGLVRVGKISRAHGLRGALRVTLDHANSVTLQTVGRVFLECDGGTRAYALRTAARIGRNAIRLELEGVTTCEAAEALRGVTVFVSQEELPAAGVDEFYNFRAIGCDVITTEGHRLGTVAEIFETGANDVLVVRDGATEVLIPVIADVVKSLDFVDRQILIDVLPGLLD